jgi:hypothetical protein
MKVVFEQMKKWVKYNGKWVEAVECTHKMIYEPYYKIGDRIYSTRDLDEIGEQITETE